MEIGIGYCRARESPPITSAVESVKILYCNSGAGLLASKGMHSTNVAINIIVFFIMVSKSSNFL